MFCLQRNPLALPAQIWEPCHYPGPGNAGSEQLPGSGERGELLNAAEMRLDKEESGTTKMAFLDKRPTERVETAQDQKRQWEKRERGGNLFVRNLLEMMREKHVSAQQLFDGRTKRRQANSRTISIRQWVETPQIHQVGRGDEIRWKDVLTLLWLINTYKLRHTWWASDPWCWILSKTVFHIAFLF